MIAAPEEALVTFVKPNWSPPRVDVLLVLFSVMVVLVLVVPVIPEPLKANVMFVSVKSKSEALFKKSKAATEKFVVVAVGERLMLDIVLSKSAVIEEEGTPTGLQLVDRFKLPELVPSQRLSAKSERGKVERIAAVHRGLRPCRFVFVIAFCI